MFVLLTTKKYELENRSANQFVSNDLKLTLGRPQHDGRPWNDLENKIIPRRLGELENLK